MSQSKISTHMLGYPRIGEKRELKKATEAYWKGRLSRSELEQVGRRIREANWKKQSDAGMDLVSCNDFSFYDHVLDQSCLLGNVPTRFGQEGENTGLDTMFRVARGRGLEGHGGGDACCASPGSSFASEMTKWFDTNYHYIVPEFCADTRFEVSTSKVFDEFAEAQALGYRAKPVLLGPISYLLLGKVRKSEGVSFQTLDLLDRLLSVYERIVFKLAERGAEWLQLDEPILCTDLSERERAAFAKAYSRLAKASGAARILVATYFGKLGANLETLLELPVAAVHVDAVRAPDEVDRVLALIPKDKILSLGIVDGRNVWKNEYERSLLIVGKAKERIGLDRLWLAPSCSLLHAPITLANEAGVPSELLDWFAFADQKLAEVENLRQLALGTAPLSVLNSNRQSMKARRDSAQTHDPAVRNQLTRVAESEYSRASPFEERQKAQRAKLQLPAFPTTTIGSFPQTKEVRQARAKSKSGTWSDANYDTFIREQIRDCVAFQDEIGIDMPVHGEFERNDMVEYFGERLSGFLFTTNGWVQSYGSRCVKPPIIYGDVSRPEPMTTYWAEYAQSLTDKPMKGMLTGPVTILQWSFARDDQPRSETAKQIALAIRGEALDLEALGIAAIQIDEPALREGLPLLKEDWQAYLDWAVAAFRLCSSGVRDETQIHTHMCYAEFNDIISAIADLDADVITIETSRSNMELLDAFVGFEYKAEIGPGVYDIHSPRVPTVDEMERLMQKAAQVLPSDNLWVNPDCGLKTRGWSEVRASLRNMMACARTLRKGAATTNDVPRT